MRKVVNPALMMVVQLDSTPSTALPLSTAEHADDGDERMEVQDPFRSTSVPGTTK